MLSISKIGVMGDALWGDNKAVNLYNRRKPLIERLCPQPTVTQHAKEPAAAPHDQSQTALARVKAFSSEIEERYQHWVQKHFNQIFSYTRQHQMQTLGVELDTLTISPEDRWLNRELAMRTGVVAVA